MTRKIKIDDRSIAKPPYSGPKKDKLPDKKLSQEQIDDMLAQLFSELEKPVGKSVEKAQDLEKLVKRQAEDDDLGPPLEDDDPFWEVDDAYQEELAARVEAGLKKSTEEEAEGD